MLKLSFLILGVFANAIAANPIFSLKGETGGLQVDVELTTGELFYQVRDLSADHPVLVIEKSPLGLERSDEDLTQHLTWIETAPAKQVEDEFRLMSGKRLDIKQRGIEQTATFKNENGALLAVTIRVYTDGIAFRYSLPGHGKQLKFIPRETTGFSIPVNGRVWLQPYSKVATWSPGYEAKYENGIQIGTEAPAAEGWALPALFQVAQHWILLTETGLDESYFASHLEPKAEHGLYRLRPPEDPETYGVAPQFAATSLPWSSPWRLLIIGHKLSDIVESNLPVVLAKPSEVKETQWIKPGRASWSWWSDMSSPSDFEKLTPFIDLAHQLHWEYSTIDLGWSSMKNGDVEQLVDYAKKREVGLLLWYNSGGKHNQVPDAGPANRMSDPIVRDHEMSRIEKLGIKGMKIDFMQSDKQYLIGMYLDILRDAARHHLVVDFHGATIPRGWTRTFPNLLSMEAVAGAEQYWSSDYAENAQTIDTIYPFTRNVLGPMDYTPLIFADAAHLKAHRTTNAHELALSVVFESGIQHFVDAASDLVNQPKFVRDFLRDVPVIWDETRLVDGYPGELAVLARRSGKTWYLGGINGLKEPRNLSIPLTFLGSGKFHIQLIEDGTTPHEFNYRELKAGSTDLMVIKLAARGGFVAQLQQK